MAQDVEKGRKGGLYSNLNIFRVPDKQNGLLKILMGFKQDAKKPSRSILIVAPLPPFGQAKLLKRSIKPNWCVIQYKKKRAKKRLFEPPLISMILVVLVSGYVVKLFI